MMKRGAWHQFGDRSQKLALERLERGAGVGVVISPRDLSRERAIELAPQYRERGADVMIDPQFYIPDSGVGKLSSYEAMGGYRKRASQLSKLADQQIEGLQAALNQLNEDVGASAVIAPAVVYEAGRPDIVDLNAKLFSAARKVGESLGVPTLATLVLGASVTASDQTVESALSDATSLPADGWYFAFEFGEQRVPSSYSSVLRFCKTALTLACTGKPVFHAFCGPVSLLSPCVGATGVGIGHSQNLWQFTRDRWQPVEGGGGGGDAPPRLFAVPLWGTIIYEDEFALLSGELRAAILTSSPFSTSVTPNPPYLPWSRWDANKHLVYLLATEASAALSELDAEKACTAAIERLTQSLSLHSRITTAGVALADNTNSYQNPWRAALNSLLAGSGVEFELLRMLRGI